jgi:hypothetical protein
MTAVFNHNPKMLIVLTLFAILMAAVAPTLMGHWGHSSVDDCFPQKDVGENFFFYIFTPDAEHCVGRVNKQEVADAIDRRMAKLGQDAEKAMRDANPTADNPLIAAFDDVMEMFFKYLTGQGPHP